MFYFLTHLPREERVARTCGNAFSEMVASCGNIASKESLRWDESLGLRTYTIAGGKKPSTRVGIPS